MRDSCKISWNSLCCAIMVGNESYYKDTSSCKEPSEISKILNIRSFCLMT